MDNYAAALKALGHVDRLRICALLSHGELTVSELVQIMGLSQPRITQYIRTLEATGFVERVREGSWVFSRLRRYSADRARLITLVMETLPNDDPILTEDRKHLEIVRKARSKISEAFFAEVANDRSQLGSEYLPQDHIEQEMLDLAGGGPFEHMVDLGTGTGRMLQLFGTRTKRGIGIDNSADMLKVARHTLSSNGHGHFTLRQSDLTQTPLNDGCADLVSLHQVLHYLDDPQDAISEAGRLLDDGGQLLIVDFTSHDQEHFREDYAHRRLGFSDQDIDQMLQSAGLRLEAVKTIKAQQAVLPDVNIWKGLKTHSEQRAAQ